MRPNCKHDDFAGLDLKGKIAVMFAGAPEKFDNDRRAFYSSQREKSRVLVERGAIGVVVLNNAEDEARVPWSRAADNWNKPGMRLRGADGKGLDTFPQLQAGAGVSAAAADALFAGTGKTAAQLYKAVKAGTATGFDLPGTLLLAGRTAHRAGDLAQRRRRSCRAAMPRSAASTSSTPRTSTMSASARRSTGDAIYNGALDNALGVAILLEAARELHAGKDHPKRSALFLALTGEEKGLLGAEWFAQQPTVPRESLVANINMDMPVLLAPTSDVVPIGIEHSSLQPLVAQAAKDVGVTLSPDPFPEEVVFVRSDQYAFIRAGIPAVYLDGGVVARLRAATRKAGARRSDPKLAMREFLRSCYHQPCDDASQPIQYADAARLARLNARIGTLVGNIAERPRWNEGDFFGERFGRAAAEPAARRIDAAASAVFRTAVSWRVSGRWLDAVTLRSRRGRQVPGRQAGVFLDRAQHDAGVDAGHRRRGQQAPDHEIGIGSRSTTTRCSMKSMSPVRM